MKILWRSNAPFTVSGYGLQTALFVPMIAAMGHEVVISAPHSFGGSPLAWKGFTVLPCAGDPHGTDSVALEYQRQEADLLITLCDVFALGPAAGDLQGMNVAHWFPVDCSPMGEDDLYVLREGQGIPIAMSRFGEKMLRDEGADPIYVPHGVATDVFRPGGRKRAREILDIREETFLVGVNAMNRDPVRKGLTEQIAAFAAFHEHYPDSLLMMNTVQRASPGTDLIALATRLGILDAIRFPDQYNYLTGQQDQQTLSSWYQALDVLSACSYGEGFCLPVLEAQACGIPVVVTDCSALTEMCGAGWTVEGERYWCGGHNAWWMRPSAREIAVAYEMAWRARENGEMPALGVSARSFASLYEVNRVAAEYWEPCLKEISARIGRS